MSLFINAARVGYDHEEIHDVFNDASIFHWQENSRMAYVGIFLGLPNPNLMVIALSRPYQHLSSDSMANS